MKTLQRQSAKLWGADRQTKAWRSLQRQNAIARRYGLRLLTLTLNLFLASVAITFTYYAAMELYERGYFNPPQTALQQSQP